MKQLKIIDVDNTEKATNEFLKAHKNAHIIEVFRYQYGHMMGYKVFIEYDQEG